MKGTTNAQRNAIVDSTSAVDSLTLTKADGTTQQHKVSEMIPTDSEPTSGSSKFVTSGGVYNAISTVNSSISSLQSQVASKQDALTFDSTPTENSTNPVTSGGVYSAINISPELTLSLDENTKILTVTVDGVSKTVDLSGIGGGGKVITEYTTISALYNAHSSGEIPLFSDIYLYTRDTNTDNISTVWVKYTGNLPCPAVSGIVYVRNDAESYYSRIVAMNIADSTHMSFLVAAQSTTSGKSIVEIIDDIYSSLQFIKAIVVSEES